MFVGQPGIPLSDVLGQALEISQQHGRSLPSGADWIIRVLPQTAVLGRCPSLRSVSGARSAFLLVLADREALSWVVETGQMAFTRSRRRDAAALNDGDLLLLYTTRGCFRNPTRDRGKVIGEAVVEGTTKELTNPVELAGRSFTIGCRISIRRLTPVRSGVELSPLVPDLQAFPDSSSWSARMRRPLVPLPSSDVNRIRSELRRVTADPLSVMNGYRQLRDP